MVLPIEATNQTLFLWTRSGKNFSYARGGDWYNSTYSRQELAYVMIDRPLFKPGETAGFKVFLRSREAGPTQPIANREVQLYVTDPQGKQIANPTLKTNEFGTASLSVPIPKSATLGQWNVRVQAVSGSYFQQGSYTFRVEEYKPPEASVSVEPVGNPKPGEPVKLKVKASYLSGGPIANVQGRALITVTQWAHQWAPWPDEKSDQESPGYTGGYDDDDFGYRGRGRGGYYGYGQLGAQTVQFKTGADGTAEVTAETKPEWLNQSLQFSAQVFVTDNSRREINGSGTVKVVATPFFVDVRSGHYLYKPGEKVSLELRAEDANGRPADPEVVVRLMRIADDGKTSKIAETRTKLAKGRGLVQLEADALGMVRAEVIDAAATGDAIPVLAQTDLWLTSDVKPMAPNVRGFVLYSDKKPLKVGDAMRALLVTPRAGGHALLTLENDQLVTARVVELNGRAKFVEIPLPASAAPNVWLFATRFENTEFLRTQQALKVTGSSTELKVGVSFGRAVAEPGSKLNATVTASGVEGTPATETALTVVDEALFAIEPEKKDFMSFFGVHPRQLTVRSYSTLDERRFRPRPLPAQPKTNANEMEAQRERKDKAFDEDDSPSGAPADRAPRPAPTMAAAPSAKKAMASADMMAKEESPARLRAAEPMTETDAPVPGGGPPIKVRTDFGSSSGWFAALSGKVGAPSTQAVQLTDSLTSWKAVATVITAGPNFGQGSASLKTAKQLMVRLQAPRFFIENDQVTLSAVVESHLNKPADVEVSIDAPGFKGLTPAKKTLHIDPEGIMRFDANFKVSELGDRTIRATVKGAGTGDAMEWKLPALVHGSAQRQFFSGRLRNAFKFEFDVPEKRKPSLTRFELAISPSLLSVMTDALPYLAQYPYGCVEQTLSRFVPAAIARKTVMDLNLPSQRIPKDLDVMVAQGLERLMMFQHADGGWGWWQTDTTNKWMTAYVIYALALARDAGLPVNAGSIERGRSYLQNHLGETLGDAETHAFMVYALSATGSVPKASLDAVFERRTKLSPRARGQLALALLNAKDARARIAVENLDDIVKAAQSRADAAVGEANDIWSTSAAIEATAFTLMAISRYDLKSPLIAPLTDFLVLRRNGGKWRNTRDTAFAVYALADLARREAASLSSGSFVVFVNGREFKRLSYSNGGLDLAPLELKDSDLKSGKNVIEVKRDAAGTGYFAGTLDVFNQNDFIKGVGGDVTLKRTYTLLGKPSTTKMSAETEYGMPVESGVRVRVDVEVTANKAVEFVMVEDLKPAGFEAVMVRSGPEVCNFACAHAELRSDRVAMFLSQIPVGTTKVSYELRAEVPGKFAALPARVEAMYAPEITATADEMRFEVRDAPEGNVATH